MAGPAASSLALSTARAQIQWLPVCHSPPFIQPLSPTRCPLSLPSVEETIHPGLSGRASLKDLARVGLSLLQKNLENPAQIADGRTKLRSEVLEC